jgi:hypothetical protein
MANAGYYRERDYLCADGKAAPKGAFCHKKLCLVATELDHLLAVLDRMLERDDCFWVKYSPDAKAGMFLARVVLTDAKAVGTTWRELKADPKLMCSIQDDDFANLFR